MRVPVSIVPSEALNSEPARKFRLRTYDCTGSGAHYSGTPVWPYLNLGTALPWSRCTVLHVHVVVGTGMLISRSTGRSAGVRILILQST